MEFADPWGRLLTGYVLTVIVETLILAIGLSKRNSLSVRLYAGAWLTACTYPAVNVIIPFLFKSTDLYLAEVATAEVFAAVAECALFWAAFSRRSAPGRGSPAQDFATITFANVASFGSGELLINTGLF
jgi:hypothetical protein